MVPNSSMRQKGLFLIRISRCVFIPFVFLRLRTYYVLEGQTLPGVRRSPFLVFLCLGLLLLLILERTAKCHEAASFSWVWNASSKPPFSGKIALFLLRADTQRWHSTKKSQTMFFRFSPNYSTPRTIGVVSFYVGRRRFLPRFIPFVYWLAALLHLGWLCFISYAFNRFLFSLSRNGLFHSYLVHCVELPSRMSNKIVSFLK